MSDPQPEVPQRPEATVASSASASEPTVTEKPEDQLANSNPVLPEQTPIVDKLSTAVAIPERSPVDEAQVQPESTTTLEEPQQSSVEPDGETAEFNPFKLMALAALPENRDEYFGGLNGNHYSFSPPATLVTSVRKKILDFEDERAKQNEGKEPVVYLSDLGFPPLTQQEYAALDNTQMGRYDMGIHPKATKPKSKVSAKRNALIKHCERQWDMDFTGCKRFSTYKATEKVQMSYSVTTYAADKWGWFPEFTMIQWEKTLGDRSASQIRSRADKPSTPKQRATGKKGVSTRESQAGTRIGSTSSVQSPVPPTQPRKDGHMPAPDNRNKAGDTGEPSGKPLETEPASGTKLNPTNNVPIAKSDSNGITSGTNDPSGIASVVDTRELSSEKERPPPNQQTSTPVVIRETMPEPESIGTPRKRSPGRETPSKRARLGKAPPRLQTQNSIESTTTIGESTPIGMQRQPPCTPTPGPKKTANTLRIQFQDENEFRWRMYPGARLEVVAWQLCPESPEGPFICRIGSDSTELPLTEESFPAISSRAIQQDTILFFRLGTFQSESTPHIADLSDSETIGDDSGKDNDASEHHDEDITMPDAPDEQSDTSEAPDEQSDTSEAPDEQSDTSEAADEMSMQTSEVAVEMSDPTDELSMRTASMLNELDEHIKEMDKQIETNHASASAPLPDLHIPDAPIERAYQPVSGEVTYPSIATTDSTTIDPQTVQQIQDCGSRDAAARRFQEQLTGVFGEVHSGNTQFPTPTIVRGGQEAIPALETPVPEVRASPGRKQPPVGRKNPNKPMAPVIEKVIPPPPSPGKKTGTRRKNPPIVNESAVPNTVLLPRREDDLEKSKIDYTAVKKKTKKTMSEAEQEALRGLVQSSDESELSEPEESIEVAPTTTKPKNQRANSSKKTPKKPVAYKVKKNTAAASKPANTQADGTLPKNRWQKGIETKKRKKLEAEAEAAKASAVAIQTAPAAEATSQGVASTVVPNANAPPLQPAPPKVRTTRRKSGKSD
ncbi:hypothetical protein BJ508DRAFT_309022 [Ascobolus immersus RN42]|uniref:Uncharacterized protein n=1 Tax=Ascobolus immersus RN42 TaxID=1160509 RepID=A0A3N4I396_ASCIM|nr:hypothetical protein BJ508DRAFT_309022 [Ascobolus immersus RN42]